MKKVLILIALSLVIILLQFSVSSTQSWQELMDSSKYYQEKQDYQTALQWAFQAETKAKTEFGEMDTNYVNSLNSIVKCYYNLGNANKAIEYCERSKPIIKQIRGGESPEYAEVLGNLGFLNDAIGNYKDAEPLFKEALEMKRGIFKGDHPDLARLINDMAVFYNGIGNYKEDEPLYREALEMRRRIYKGDHPELATSINNMAYFYGNRGNYKEAEPLCMEALEMRRRIYKGDHPELANSIGNMAYFYDKLGNYKDAEPLYREALEMQRRIHKGDHPGLANSIGNMASFYNRIGNFVDAEPFYREALDMRRRIHKSDHPDLATSINNMAYFYNAQGNYKEAEPLLKEVLGMDRRIYKTDHPDLASSINNMAYFYNARGNYKEAEALYIEALEMDKRIHKSDHPDIAISINNMATFYNRIGKYKEAELLYKETLEIYRRMFKSDHPDIAYSLNIMAEFYYDRGKYKEADPLYLEALQIYQNMLNNYFPSLSEKEKKQFWATVSDKFESFNNFGVITYIENPSIIGTMYNMQLYTKALLFNSSSRVKKRIMNSNDSALIDKFKEFTDARELLVKLYTMTETERTKKGFNLDSLEKRVNELEKELSLKSESFAQSYDKKKVTWKSIQTLLNPDEAAVEVIRIRYKDKSRFTDTIFYAFLIVTDKTEEHPEMIVLEKGNELEKDAYNYYRKMIKFTIRDTNSFAKYWGDIYEKLKGFKKIYLSADGIYNKLNPETFLMPNGRYLFEEQDIQQVNSTKDLLIGYNKAKQESNIYNSAVLIGNPNFSLSDSQVKAKGLKIDTKKEEESNSETDASTRGIELTRLPGTEKEVKDIEKLLKEKNWKVNSYLGDMALKTAVKTANNPRILHIATHGMFLEDVKLENKETFGFETKKVIENPLLRSGLFFSGADNYFKSDSAKPTGNENGLLTAYEAMNLDLDKTELVVLSACETGLGDIQNGEGVFGLRRAFQQAGAKTVVMSLWTVSDEATQKLMSSFYRNWITGMSKREAFRSAQQEIKNKYSDPYYWGAFVMVGE